MPKLNRYAVEWIVCTALSALAMAGCSGDVDSGEPTGGLVVNLELASGVDIDEVEFQITGGGMEPMGGIIDTSAPGSTASVEVFGIAAGDGYIIEMIAESTDGEVMCAGSAEFDVEVGVATELMVMLNCKLPSELGGVRANGKFNICAQLTKVVVSPLQTSVGSFIDVSAAAIDVENDDIQFAWTDGDNCFDDPSAPETVYECKEVGEQEITITISDDEFDYCTDSWTVLVTCVDGGGGTGGVGGDGGAGGEAGAGGAAGESSRRCSAKSASRWAIAAAQGLHAEQKLADGFDVIGQRVGAGDLPVLGGDAVAAQVGLGDLDDIVAAVAVLGPGGSAGRLPPAAGLHGAGEVLDLLAGVVVVELARHLPARGPEQAAEAVADGRAAAVAHMQRARGVGRDELHLYLAAVALIALAEALAGAQGLGHHRRAGIGGEEEIDEARAGDLRPLDRRICGQRLADAPGEVPWLHPRALGESEGDVAGEVAV